MRTVVNKQTGLKFAMKTVPIGAGKVRGAKEAGVRGPFLLHASFKQLRAETPWTIEVAAFYVKRV